MPNGRAERTISVFFVKNFRQLRNFLHLPVGTIAN
jgi:hypothetical protein